MSDTPHTAYCFILDKQAPGDPDVWCCSCACPHAEEHLDEESTPERETPPLEREIASIIDQEIHEGTVGKGSALRQAARRIAALASPVDARAEREPTVPCADCGMSIDVGWARAQRSRCVVCAAARSVPSEADARERRRQRRRRIAARQEQMLAGRSVPQGEPRGLRECDEALAELWQVALRVIKHQPVEPSRLDAALYAGRQAYDRVRTAAVLRRAIEEDNRTEQYLTVQVLELQFQLDEARKEKEELRLALNSQIRRAELAEEVWANLKQQLTLAQKELERPCMCCFGGDCQSGCRCNTPEEAEKHE